MQEQEFRTLILEVHRARERFIEIQDDVFRASWRRVLPIPGFFQKIDFPKRLVEIEQIKKSLVAIKAELENISDFSITIPRNYVLVLSRYVGMLLSTVNQLITICTGLKNKYNWGAYKEDLKTYEQMRKSCSTIGGELNQEQDLYQQSNPQEQAPKTSDRLLSKAEMLVRSASVNAVSMFVPLLDKFPSLRKVDPKHWDFILTVAGVFIAASRLRSINLDESHEHQLTNLIYERFNEWDSNNAVRAFEDCKQFFDRNYDALTQAGHDPQFVASDSIGLWITWKVLRDRSNNDEQRKLVRTVGAMITHTFFNWWNNRNVK
jgi:hypothetical protein